MKKSIFILAIIFATFIFWGSDSNYILNENKLDSIIGCGSTMYDDWQRMAIDENYKNEAAKYESFVNEYIKTHKPENFQPITIPVVIHILYKESNDNVSKSEIDSQIAILNDDFNRRNRDANLTPTRFLPDTGSSQIFFQLATTDPKGRPTSGIIRKSTQVDSFNIVEMKYKDTAQGGSNPWPSGSYLNIWVCKIFHPAASRLYGFANWPWDNSIGNGVVIHRRAFSNINVISFPETNKGRTLTHEVGHWLGLRHIWGDTWCGDDFVDDTPQQHEKTPIDELCHLPNIIPSKCKTNADGYMYMNYMDYTKDDCKNMFTVGQCMRMQAAIDSASNLRHQLRFSNGLSQPDPGKNNILVEYVAGTWCQYCPCAQRILDSLSAIYNNLTVVEYHYGSQDPWHSSSDSMWSFLGNPIGVPLAIIGRRTGFLQRYQWANNIAVQNTVYPDAGVKMDITNKEFNQLTRQLIMDVKVTALKNYSLSNNSSLNINGILTENNLFYNQTGNTECPANTSIHNNVVKGVMNSPQGANLNIPNPWDSGQSITSRISYIIPASVLEYNTDVMLFVYEKSTNTGNNYNGAQQSNIEPTERQVIGILGNPNIIPKSYSLSQNYPNPFNPVTNIHFTLPKPGNVSLKVFDILGRLVTTFMNEYLQAGSYNAEFNGAYYSSGIYFYSLITDDFAETKKMILIK